MQLTAKISRFLKFGATPEMDKETPRRFADLARERLNEELQFDARQGGTNGPSKVQATPSPHESEFQVGRELQVIN